MSLLFLSNFIPTRASYWLKSRLLIHPFLPLNAGNPTVTVDTIPTLGAHTPDQTGFRVAHHVPAYVAVAERMGSEACSTDRTPSSCAPLDHVVKGILLMFPVEDVYPESHARKETVADVSWASCGHASTDLVNREVYGVGPSFDGRCKTRLANQ